MKDSQLDKMTIKELKELRARVDKTMASKHDQERSGLKEKFKEMAEEAGFNLAEIVGGARGRGRNSSAVAKFVNPENTSQTWSGRGRMPKWLSERVKAGEKTDKYRA